MRLGPQAAISFLLYAGMTLAWGPIRYHRRRDWLQERGTTTPGNGANKTYWIYWQEGMSNDLPTAEHLEGVTHVSLFMLKSDTFKFTGNWADADEYQAMRKSLSATAPGVKVYATYGGEDATTQFQGDSTKLAQSLKGAMDTYSLDGIDIDWEFPKANGDADKVKSILTELRKQIGNDKGISWALPSVGSADNGYNPGNIDIATLNSLVNYFNLMTYDNADFNGVNSVTTAHSSGDLAKKAVESWSTAKLDMSKANLGFPMYAYVYQMTPSAAKSCSTRGNSVIGCKLFDPEGDSKGSQALYDGWGTYTTKGKIAFNDTANAIVAADQKFLQQQGASASCQAWNSASVSKDSDVHTADYQTSAWVDAANSYFWSWVSPQDVLDICMANKATVGGMMVWSMNMDYKGHAGGHRIDALQTCLK